MAVQLINLYNHFIAHILLYLNWPNIVTIDQEVVNH